jgi:hypothetical protein
MNKTVFIRFKWKIIPLLVAGLLVFSCTQKENDYTLIPSGGIFAGNLDDGRTFYFIRNDSAEMSGICFVHDRQAVVEIIPYTAYPSRSIVFQCDNQSYEGRITVDSEGKLHIALPSIPNYAIKKQKINPVYQGKVPDCFACLERYREAVFEGIVSDTDVRYGKATGYYTSKPMDKTSNDDYEQIGGEIWKEFKNTIILKGRTELSLYMDVYQPDKDTYKKRPLFLFIHGGAFFFGDKNNPTQRYLTDRLVKKGYVVVSVNYRLGSTLMGYPAIERAIYRGVQDVRAALRHIVYHSEDLGIDVDRIYIGGSSAGGIIALTAAFMDEHEKYESATGSILRSDLGDLNESGNTLDVDVRIAGVISLWGGMSDLNFIDKPVPTLLFHGTADDIVQCDSGLPFKNLVGSFWHDILALSWKLYGSSAIYEYMNSRNMPVKYVPFEGYGHEPNMDSDGSFNRNMDEIENEITQFLYSRLSERFNCTLEGKTSVNPSSAVTTYRVNVKGTETVRWNVTGGFIIASAGNSIQVVWYNTGSSGNVTACITDEDGISYKREMAVAIVNLSGTEK